MASIVELRQMSNEKIEEKLENAREEMFNLRFQHASARLDDMSRLRKVRRDIAQYVTVLNQRDLATDAASRQPDIAKKIGGATWHAEVHFSYEDSAWKVEFFDDDDNEIASTFVDLNKKSKAKKRG